MHWNVAPDALPGSARLVRVLDRWPNDCDKKCNLERLYYDVYMKQGS